MRRWDGNWSRNAWGEMAVVLMVARILSSVEGFAGLIRVNARTIGNLRSNNNRNTRSFEHGHGRGGL
jgi:hypothetical protein